MSKEFKRQDWHKKKKLGTSWRKPKGFHSKQRKSKAGKPKLVRIGRKRKSEEKIIFRINSLKDFESNLQKIKKEKPILSISARLGLSSKIKILEEVVSSKLPVENMRKPELVLERLKKKLANKQQKRKEVSKRKQNKIKLSKENKETKDSNKKDSDKKDEKKEDNSNSDVKDIKNNKNTKSDSK